VLATGRSPPLPHPKPYETAWSEDLSFALAAEESSRLTKPLKLINSCARRDVRLISLRSSGAGATQLPGDERREPQASHVSVVCSSVPSQLPINDGWGEQRQQAKHVQPEHTAQSHRIQAVLFALRAGGRSQKRALLLLEGGFAGAFCGSRRTLVQGAFENPLLKCKCFPSLKPT